MRVSIRIVLAVSAVSFLCAALVGQPTAGASMPQLNATGSSYASVAMSEWEGLFNEQDGGNVNFTVSSSIVGLNDFCNQTVSFALSDLSYAAGLSDCSPSQVPYPYQYIPDVGGSLAFEYNLQGPNGKRITDLVLNAPTLLGIFTGSINNWDNAAIQALNPGTPMPDEAITAFYRSDPSGENYLLSDYFSDVDPGPLSAFQQVADVPTTPGTPSATWADFTNGVPPNLDSLIGDNGSDAASQEPLLTHGGISYVETAYSKNVGLPVASLVNEAGDAVQPTAENGIEALQGATLNADLSENLTGVFDDTAADAYPLSSYSYFVAPCSPSFAAAEQPPRRAPETTVASRPSPASQGAELGQFIDFAVCSGQAHVAQLGYAALPEQLVEDAFAAIGRIDGATEPPPPTATNCPNPDHYRGDRHHLCSRPADFAGFPAGAPRLSVPRSSAIVGDAWVLAVRVSNSSINVSSVTGGGVGDHWTKLARVSDVGPEQGRRRVAGPDLQDGVTRSHCPLLRGRRGNKGGTRAQEFSSASARRLPGPRMSVPTRKRHCRRRPSPTRRSRPRRAVSSMSASAESSSAPYAGSTPGFSYEFWNAGQSLHLRPECLVQRLAGRV